MDSERKETGTPCGNDWLYACPLRKALSRQGLTYAPVARKIAAADAVRARYEPVYHCGTECAPERCMRLTGAMPGSPRALAWEKEHASAQA